MAKKMLPKTRSSDWVKIAQAATESRDRLRLALRVMDKLMDPARLESCKLYMTVNIQDWKDVRTAIEGSVNQLRLAVKGR